MHPGLSYLYKEFGAFDVNDKGHREVSGQTSGTVALGDKGRQTAAPSPTHGQINHKLKVILSQLLQDASLWWALSIDCLVKVPVDSCYLWPRDKVRANLSLEGVRMASLKGEEVAQEPMRRQYPQSGDQGYFYLLEAESISFFFCVC